MHWHLYKLEEIPCDEQQQDGYDVGSQSVKHSLQYTSTKRVLFIGFVEEQREGQQQTDEDEHQHVHKIPESLHIDAVRVYC